MLAVTEFHPLKWQNGDRVSGPNPEGSRLILFPRERDWGRFWDTDQRKVSATGPSASLAASPLQDTEMTCTYTASLWGGQGLPQPIKNCYDNKSSLPSYERQTWPTPQHSHHRGSVLGSHPFPTWAVPVSALLVPLCLSFLPCACAVTPALPQAYQENWWNNVCEVFSFARMKRAMTTKLKQYYRTFLSCNHFCLLNCRTTRRIKAVSRVLTAALEASSLHLAETPRREVCHDCELNQISRQVVQWFPGIPRVGETG